MAFTATQYLFKASAQTATTSATTGAYTVPAATRGMVIACTIANTSTTGNARNYVDVQVWDGSTAYDVAGKRTPIDPGGSFVVVGLQHHVLPTGGAVYVTPYATTGIVSAMTVIEVT